MKFNKKLTRKFLVVFHVTALLQNNFLFVAFRWKLNDDMFLVQENRNKVLSYIAVLYKQYLRNHCKLSGEKLQFKLKSLNAVSNCLCTIIYCG